MKSLGKKIVHCKQVLVVTEIFSIGMIAVTLEQRNIFLVAGCSFQPNFV